MDIHSVFLKNDLVPVEKGADVLFDRPAPADYILEWSELLKKEVASLVHPKTSSVVIFRIADEWLCLSTYTVSQVIEMRKVHQIPHHTSILLGVLNVRGQLRLCVALHTLLQIERQEIKEWEKSPVTYNRMIVIEKEKDLLVFPVEEVYGIKHFELDKLENVPVNVMKLTTNYFKGVYKWENKSIGYLDEEFLFYNLKRKIL